MKTIRRRKSWPKWVRFVSCDAMFWPLATTLWSKQPRRGHTLWLRVSGRLEMLRPRLVPGSWRNSLRQVSAQKGGGE